MRRDPEAPISHTQLKLLGIENQEVVKIKAGTEDGSEEVTAKGNLADGIEDSMTSSKETPSGDSDLSLIAIGRLAQGANALSEGMPTLVRADWRWEQLCDCLERMRDWGGCLLDKKMQVRVQSSFPFHLLRVSWLSLNPSFIANTLIFSLSFPSILLSNFSSRLFLIPGPLSCYFPRSKV